MTNVYVHPRVFKRHPDIEEADVLSAWANAIELACRESEDGVRFVAVGCDSKGRLIEMVAIRNDFDYLIFHAMTPPSGKTLYELRLQGR